MKVVDILRFHKRDEYENYFTLDLTNVLYLTETDKKFYETLDKFSEWLMLFNKDPYINNRINLDTGTKFLFHKDVSNSFNKDIVDYTQNSLKKQKIINKVRSATKANVLMTNAGYTLDTNYSIFTSFYLLTIDIDSLIAALVRNNKTNYKLTLTENNSLPIDLITYLTKYKSINLLFDINTFDKREYINNNILTISENYNSSEVNLFYELCLYDNVELSSQIIFTDLQTNFVNFQYDDYNNLFEIFCNFYKLNGSKSDFISWVDTNIPIIINNIGSSVQEPIYLPIITINNFKQIIYNSKFDSDKEIMSINESEKILSLSYNDPLFKYKVLSFKDNRLNSLYYYAIKVIGRLTINDYDTNLKQEIRNYYPSLFKILNLNNESIKSVEFKFTDDQNNEETIILYLLSENDVSKSSSLVDFKGKLGNFIHSATLIINAFKRDFSFSKEEVGKHIGLVEEIVKTLFLQFLSGQLNVTIDLFLREIPLFINYNLAAEEKAKLYDYNSIREMKVMEHKLVPQTQYYGAVIKRGDG